jgi:Fur family peroxide stress response transcriptional regulator
MSSMEQTTTEAEARTNRIIRALRQRKQRVTPQRLAVLHAFLSRTDHPSAESLLKEVRESFPLVAPSTVYHTLRTLVEIGEAVEVSPVAPPARFDPNTGDHCHLVCRACGSIVDIPLEHCGEPEDDTALLTEHGFRPTGRVHQVTGLCRNCRPADQDEG